MFVIHQNLQSIGNCLNGSNKYCLAFCSSEHWKSESQLQNFNFIGYELLTFNKLSKLFVFECAVVEVVVGENKITILYIQGAY